ncbi:MAG: hypothetical protein COB02_00570 [Candidatus Cloacimonadota bacterium]|nr:MAG: hypothetical protein COB02_00570 [Candidatus Cloacimonadota bacterium]
MTEITSNFSFLQSEWPTFFRACIKAESYVNSDARAACFYSRFALEVGVKWLYDNDDYLTYPYSDNLAALLHESSFKNNLDPRLFPKLQTIQKQGNQAVHSQRDIKKESATHIIKELWHFSFWMFRSYSKWADQAQNITFDLKKIPQKKSNHPPFKKEHLQALLKEFEDSKQKLSTTNKELEVSQSEILELRTQIQALKTKNQNIEVEHDYNEADTRAFYIDVLLQEAGWALLGKNDKEYEVSGMPNKTGIGYVDYVLWGEDGKPLAVVEAKRTSKDAQVGKQQAKLYADCLENQFNQRPIIFYSNGYETFLWDDKNYPPRQVQGFYKQDELQLIIHRRSSKKKLENFKINEEIAGGERYYQTMAIQKVCENWQSGHRKSLVVMATGTGKTRTVIALVDILRKYNWIKRVLFLADRNALVTQAKKAFMAHLPESNPVDLTQVKNDKTSRVVLSTYPTIMNHIDDTKDNVKTFSIGHFDLIIIDEAHRSVYHKYKAIFEYFDSLLLGLTATPREEVDHDTYQLFELEGENPTYLFELDEAVSNGFLVDKRAFSIPLKFQRDGIKYNELSDKEKLIYELKFGDPSNEELPDEISSSALNKWLFNTDTVDKVLKKLMETGLKVNDGDRIGKTIIFAKNQKHAEFIQERFDKNYPHYKGEFARIITHKENYAQSIIEDFSEVNKNPHIAISVDMLDTGIDVPEILNLVFFKTIRSKTKFHQMIGRGTRLCPNLLGPNIDKKEFLIFDYCENFEFFSEKPEGYESRVTASISSILFKKRVALCCDIQILKTKNKENEFLKSSILDSLHQLVCGVNKNNFVVRPHLRQVERFLIRKTFDDLQAEDMIDINEHIALLPFDSVDEDISAKRFDLLILRAQHSNLLKDKSFDGLKYQIQLIASNLEAKSNIPIVEKHLNLIQEVQKSEYFEDITLSMLEQIRLELRNLLKFIDKEIQPVIYTNFQDEIGESQEILNEVSSVSFSFKQYKIKVEKQIKVNENHKSIQKLKNNQMLNSMDIIELESLLYSRDIAGSKEQFEKVYGSEIDLGQFIRSLIGLNKSAAKKVFSKLIEESTLNSTQMSFIDEIINLLTQKGTMDKSQLWKQPFDTWGTEGIMSVFRDDKMVKDIIASVENLNNNAKLQNRENYE